MENRRTRNVRRLFSVLLGIVLLLSLLPVSGLAWDEDETALISSEEAGGEVEAEAETETETAKLGGGICLCRPCV